MGTCDRPSLVRSCSPVFAARLCTLAMCSVALVVWAPLQFRAVAVCEDSRTLLGLEGLDLKGTRTQGMLPLVARCSQHVSSTPPEHRLFVQRSHRTGEVPAPPQPLSCRERASTHTRVCHTSERQGRDCCSCAQAPAALVQGLIAN